MKKSCVIYDSWADQILNLPNEIAGEYIKAILRYAIYGEDSGTDNTFINAMLVPVTKKLDEDRQKYQAKVDRAIAISERNRNEIDTKSERNQNDIEGVTDTVTVTVNNKKNKKQSFRNFRERKYDYEELLKGAADV